MILEVAILNIKERLMNIFEMHFKEVSQIIASVRSCVSHQLKKCLEIENQYILLVRWQTLEDNEIGFRGSAQYQEWKKINASFL